MLDHSSGLRFIAAGPCRPYQLALKAKVERFNGYLKVQLLLRLAAPAIRLAGDWDVATANCAYRGLWLAS